VGGDGRYEMQRLQRLCFEHVRLSIPTYTIYLDTVDDLMSRVQLDILRRTLSLHDPSPVIRSKLAKCKKAMHPCDPRIPDSFRFVPACLPVHEIHTRRINK